MNLVLAEEDVPGLNSFAGMVKKDWVYKSLDSMGGLGRMKEGVAL